MTRRMAGILVTVVMVLCLAAFVEAAPNKQEFMELCGKGTPSEIRAAIEAGADVKATDTTGLTPLHMASEKNPHPEVITVLVQAGAEVNAKTRRDKESKC